MFIVSKKGTRTPSRFDEKAVTLVRSGVRVGKMWCSGGGERVLCHVCKERFAPPVFESGFKDAWGECSHCKTPFVFHLVA